MRCSMMMSDNILSFFLWCHLFVLARIEATHELLDLEVSIILLHLIGQPELDAQSMRGCEVPALMW